MGFDLYSFLLNDEINRHGDVMCHGAIAGLQEKSLSSLLLD